MNTTTDTQGTMKRHGAHRVACQHAANEDCVLGHLMLLIAPCDVWQFSDAVALKAAADEHYRIVTGGDAMARLRAFLGGAA